MSDTRNGHKKICPQCAEAIKVAAKVCKHCGFIIHPVPKPKSTVSMIALIILGVLALLFVGAALTGPKTYRQLADVYAQQCIDNKGYGQWHGSDGVSLETHCKLMGSLKAMDEDRRDHPEKY